MDFFEREHCCEEEGVKPMEVTVDGKVRTEKGVTY
jgi:hypothetical protein